MAARQVFISHSHADTGVAHQLAQALQAAGVDVWLDELSVPVGTRWADAVRAALDAADAFLLVIGPGWQDSAWARYEMSEVLKRAWADHSKPVLPVLVGEAELPGYLRDHAVVKFRPEASRETVERLVEYLRVGGGGVRRTQEGDERVSRRLAELQDTASGLAEAEGDD